MLVIGGGITGAGVALDAATRGLRTALVEHGDFAVGHVVEELEARARRPALPPAGRGAPGVRGPRRASAPAATTPPISCGSCRSSSRSSRRTASSTARSPGPSARAMWGYDLTGGVRIGKRAPPPRRRTKRWPTCPPCRPTGWRRRTSTTTPGPTTPGSASPWPAPRPRHGAVARQLRAGGRPRQGRRRPGDRRRRSRPTADGSRCGRRVVVNATGVWSDDVRALDEGRDPRLHPARQGHPPHGALGEGAQRHRRRDPGAEGPAQPVRRAVGRPHLRRAPPTPTTTVRSTIPQCTQDDIDYVLGRSTARSPPASPSATSPGAWAGLRPARQAGAASGRTADLSRRHVVSVSAERRRQRDGRQAHDLPPHGGRHRRRGHRTARPPAARSRTKRLLLARRRRASPSPPPESAHRSPRHLAWRYGGEARRRATR